MPADNPMPQENPGFREPANGMLFEEHPDKVAVAQPDRVMRHNLVKKEPQFPSPGIQIDAHFGDGKKK